MYEWVLFFHVVGALVFMMSHGVSIFAAFQLQQEREVDRIRALMDLSTLSLRGMWGSILLLLAAGIALGFMGKWWSQGWLWVALLKIQCFSDSNLSQKGAVLLKSSTL